MVLNDHSRVGRLGAVSSQLSEDEVVAHLESSCVHLSLEPDLPGALLTLRVAVATLRRMPGRVHLDPRGLEEAFVTRLVDAATRINPIRGLELGDSIPRGALHIHVGVVPPTVSAIRAVPDGYGVHIARNAAAEITQARPAHPLGSVVTAAFAVAEVFKSTAPVIEERRVDHAHLTWCPVSLSSDLTCAAMIEGPMRLDLTLAGCGAIGTAIALILSELDATGQILVLDRQEFGPENVATYSIGGYGDARLRRRKVDLVVEVLRERYSVSSRHGDVAALVDEVDGGSVRWPRLILSGLDSVAARHAVQLIWPDRIIDAATGGTAVGLHDIVAGSGPCLMCFFPKGGPVSAQETLAQATGLPIELLGRGDDVLLERDISNLAPEKRLILRPHVGKRICNLANAPGLIAGAGDFQAAVTFVAVQAACLAVGRLIAIDLAMDLPNFVLYDTLVGPRPDALERRKPIPDCYCQQKARRIQKVRADRRGGPP